jgi:hypothetical protein
MAVHSMKPVPSNSSSSPLQPAQEHPCLAPGSGETTTYPFQKAWEGQALQAPPQLASASGNPLSSRRQEWLPGL